MSPILQVITTRHFRDCRVWKDRYVEKEMTSAPRTTAS